MPDVPDVATPVWTPALQPFQVTNYLSTPIQSTALQSRTHVQFAPSNLSLGTPMRPLAWSGDQDQMQLCTPSPARDGSQVSSGTPYDLPGTFPTPAREIGQLTAQVQGNWDKLSDLMEKQETAVSTLTSELKQSSLQHESQLKSLADKVDNHTQQMSKILLKNKQLETKTDQMVKTMRLLIMDEFKKVENSLTSNVRFMVEQLQQEVQEDIRAVQQNFKKSHNEFVEDFST